MKYCRYCGGQLEDVAQVCVHCGAYVENRQSASSTSSEANKPNAGYNILAFFFPIVGLVLWAVWKSKYPLRCQGNRKMSSDRFYCGLNFKFFEIHVRRNLDQKQILSV